MDIDPNTVLSRNPDIVFSEFGDEVVMMSTDFESYFGMEACAARIWELLEHETTFAEICDRLCEEFDVKREQCEEETRAFVADLCERELAVTGPRAPSPSGGRA